MKNLDEKLNGLLKLKDNWDSYDGVPFSKKMIEKISANLNFCPCSNGNIMISYGPEVATIDVNPEGKVVAISWDDPGQYKS